MSRKRATPFARILSDNSDMDSATEGDSVHSKRSMNNKRVKKFASSSANLESDVQILKVEPGRNEHQVEIVKVQCGTTKSPDVEIVKIVPGTANKLLPSTQTINWPIQCRKIDVQGSVGKPKEGGKN